MILFFSTVQYVCLIYVLPLLCLSVMRVTDVCLLNIMSYKILGFFFIHMNMLMMLLIVTVLRLLY